MLNDQIMSLEKKENQELGLVQNEEFGFNALGKPLTVDQNLLTKIKCIKPDLIGINVHQQSQCDIFSLMFY